VPAGHAVFIDHRGRRFQKEIAAGKKAACIFEYVYFARPDSVIDGIGVYEARLRLGKELGRECVRAGLKPDVVIPVPDTARGAAQMVAEVMGARHREGLIKNRYVFRTFIMASHDERISAIRLKLNPIRSEIAGRRVLLVDDSIVRGNTSREIIQLVRDAGAREVYYALYSPPLKYPCVYGIDMQTRGEFIARNRSIDRIRQSIRADRLVYQTTAGLLRSVGSAGSCTACFTGAYPTRVPESLMRNIERARKNKNSC
jgi:amidophosphoribosyltransferase